MTLLGIFLSVVSFAMLLLAMLVADGSDRSGFGMLLTRQFPRWFSTNTGERLRTILNGTHPDLGYAVVLCGLIFLYFSIAPRGRRPDGALPALPL